MPSTLGAKIINILSVGDIFGYPVQPYLNKDEKIKTLIGTIVAAGMISLTIALTLPTIQNYADEVNPTVTFDSDYGTSALSINDSDPFLAFSFFVPKNGSKGYANSTSDFDKIQTIKTMFSDCVDCGLFNAKTNETDQMKTAIYSQCNQTKIRSIKLHSLSSRSSRNITDIFETNSFCIPDKFRGKLVDDDLNIANFISSLTLTIPDTYKPNGTSTNAAKRLSKMMFKILGYLTILPSGKGGTPPSGKGGTPPSPETGGATPPLPGTGSQPPSPVTVPQPPSSGTTTPTKSGTATPPASGQTESPKQENPSQGSKSSNTNQQNANQVKTENTGPNLEELLKQQKQFNTFNNKDDPNCKYFLLLLDNETVTVGNLSKIISDKITANFFPRLLVIYPLLQVNPNSKTNQIVSLTHDLLNLDFRDQITGLAMVYDVIIRQTKVTYIVKSDLFFEKKILVNYFTVDSVKKNLIQGNDISKKGPTLYYKIHGQTILINIQYVLFTDILSKFGSYWTIFALGGHFLSYLYKYFYWRADLLNGVFKFHEEDEDEEEDDEFGADGKEIKSPKVIQRTRTENERQKEKNKKEMNDHFDNNAKIELQTYAQTDAELIPAINEKSKFNNKGIGKYYSNS